MRGIALASFALVAACGFRAQTGGVSGRDATGSPPDASPDSGPPAVLYANNNATLYVVDLAARSVTRVGTIRDTDTVPVESMTIYDGALVALPYQAADRLLYLDPATAMITSATALAGDRIWTGLTWVPAGEGGGSGTLLAGTGQGSGTGELHEIQPALGTTRRIGAFGNSMVVAGDIVWFPGHGLYGAMHGGTCNSTCIAKIDPATGDAQVLSSTAPYPLWSLTAFGGELRALSGDGIVYAVDPMTGATTQELDLGTFDFWDTN